MKTLNEDIFVLLSDLEDFLVKRIEAGDYDWKQATELQRRITWIMLELDKSL